MPGTAALTICGGVLEWGFAVFLLSSHKNIDKKSVLWYNCNSLQGKRQTEIEQVEDEGGFKCENNHFPRNHYNCGCYWLLYGSGNEPGYGRRNSICIDCGIRVYDSSD